MSGVKRMLNQKEKRKLSVGNDSERVCCRDYQSTVKFNSKISSRVHADLSKTIEKFKETLKTLKT